MSLLKKLKSEGLEKQEDRLGGSRTVETDIYPAKIKVAYITFSKGGAMAINLVADILYQGKTREYRETFWVTNKDGENFFYMKNDTEKKNRIGLPGFNIVNDICLVANGRELEDQDDEEKVLKVWDADEGKEINKNVPVITSLTDAEVLLAIQEILEFKQEKSGNEYVDTTDTITKNSVSKVFDPESRMTVFEATKELSDGVERTAEFYDKWLEKNKGNVFDKTKGKSGSGTKSGPPSKNTNESAPKKSLFSK